MFKVQTLNNIPVAGLEVLPRDRYEIASEITYPDVLLLRSFNLHDWDIPDSVKAVGRAGVGVDNIPIEGLTQRGVPVFNAPGANANAVKELVLAGLLVAARNVCQAWQFTHGLSGSDEEISRTVEAEKKRFKGTELQGRTLGVIGLGAIGVQVANAAHALGMRVIGYDPHITVSNAWLLSSQTDQARSVGEVLQKADFVTLHVPLVENTHHLINGQRLADMRPGTTILNFAREAIVDERAVSEALQSGRLRAYVCDFPSNLLRDRPGVVALPHLGASTQESEENCAVMVANEVRDYLEHGTLRNSVNFPELEMPRTEGCRYLVVNSNVPHMLESITGAIASADLNIIDLLNKSRGDIACTLLDIECVAPETVLERMRAVEGVKAVYAL